MCGGGSDGGAAAMAAVGVSKTHSSSQTRRVRGRGSSELEYPPVVPPCAMLSSKGKLLDRRAFPTGHLASQLYRKQPLEVRMQWGMPRTGTHFFLVFRSEFLSLVVSQSVECSVRLLLTMTLCTLCTLHSQVGKYTTLCGLRPMTPSAPR